MSGGGRKKRVSAYEPASDDESVLEFQNMEHQLMKDPPMINGINSGGTNTGNNTNTNLRKTINNGGFTQHQQDAAQPNMGKSQSQSKFKKPTTTSTVKKQGSSSSGFGSKIGPNQQKTKNNSQGVSRKQSNQKQNQTKPIAKDQQPQQQVTYINGQPVIQQNKGIQKPAQKSRGGCCGIFCCGYCCSKGAGINDKDTKEEMDLRPETKQLPDIQDMKSPKNKQYNGLEEDQDLSQIQDDEEDFENSVSNYDQHDSQQLSEVIEQQEMDDQLEMDDLGDEEKIELDLRSEMIKNPNSGEHSAGGMMMSLKSSTDPMEMKRLNQHNDDDDPLITDGNDNDDNTKNDLHHGNQILDDGHVDDSYEQDRRNIMLEKNQNKKSQPRLIEEGDDEYDVANANYHSANMDNSGDNELRQQYNSVTDPQRRYSNDQFMRIEGPSPENHQLLLPVGTITNNNSNSQTPTLSHDDGSSGRNSVEGANNQRRTKGTSGGHMRIAGDDNSNIIGGMDEDDTANVGDDSSSLHQQRDDLADDQSDKTVDNEQEQYKLAQAKRMYVIHEVDEDAFSEKSSRRDKSKLLVNNTFEKPQSAYNDHQSNHNEYQNSLQALKEEPIDDEDVYGLNNMKHQQTLSMDNDLSSMQINASQDIDPNNTSQQNIIAANGMSSHRQLSANNRSDSIKIIEDNQSSDMVARDFQQLKGQNTANKTPTPHNGQKHLQQQLISPNQNQEVQSFADYQAQGQSKSLINFQQYMEDEEARNNYRNSLTPNERTSALQDSNGQKISNILPEKQQEKSAFFRPHQAQNNKGAGQQVRASTESMNQIYEEIVLIDDFASSSNNQTPLKSSNQKNSPQPSQQPTNQQPQVIIQKLSIDKSKLSQTYYQNFDQFVIANNLNIDDQTKKAHIQSSLQDNPFDVSKGGIQDQNLLDTKQQAVKLQNQRQSLKNQQQHDQAQKIKEKVLRKEKDRMAKQQCALKIQKVWKGHVQRSEYVYLRDNLRKVKAVRGLFEKSYKKYRNGILRGLCDAIRYSKINKDEEEQELMSNFLNVCALQIQSNWRGHQYRKHALPTLIKQRRAEEQIKAFVKGWKMRKVMQTREIFHMSQNIKDLTKVQEYFVYVEKNDNMLLLGQLKKDRKKAISGYIDLINHLYSSGDWIKSYIGNKIIENEDQLDSTMDGLESNLKSPIKDYNMNDVNQLKELVTTERFLYDDDLERNPYIFESDDFVKQKFLEKRQREYMGVEIEYVDQKRDSGKQLSHGNKRNNKLKAVDDDSSRYDESESNKGRRTEKKTNNKNHKDSYDSDFFRGSINPKDNQLLPKNKKTFEQMLEDAMNNEKGESQSRASTTRGKNGKEFLKRKEKYDPQKSLKTKKSDINSKNVEKKRVFKSKNRMGSEESDEDVQDQDEIYSDDGKHRGTFKNFPRKSFIQLENDPLPTNKTIMPPSLLQKLYAEQQKILKFLRTDTGRQVGSNPTKYQPLNKNQQVYPTMPISEDLQQPSLNLLELESIFQVYHGGQDANQFHKSKTIKRDKDAQIPVLKEKALFNKYYDDQVFDSQLDEVKREYAKQVKVNKKYHFGAQKLY